MTKEHRVDSDLHSSFTALLDAVNTEYILLSHLNSSRDPQQVNELFYGAPRFWDSRIRNSAIWRGASPSKLGWLMRIAQAGIRRVEDFEVALQTYGSVERTANQVIKYKRAYIITTKLEGCNLINSATREKCLELMQSAIRRDAPADLTEHALLKIASGGKMLNLELLNSRLDQWLHSAYRNKINARNPPSPLTWDDKDILHAEEPDPEGDAWQSKDDFDIEHLLSPRKVSWKILPPGRHPFADLVRHFENLEREEKGFRSDKERLKKVYKLGEADTYVGEEGFRKYVVFEYKDYGFAILECPVAGHAIYILIGDWQSLSRLSKAELLNFHREETIRIIHNSSWYERLKEEFIKLRERNNPSAIGHPFQ